MSADSPEGTVDCRLCRPASWVAETPVQACPFCGGVAPAPRAHRQGAGVVYTLVCRRCAAEGGWATTPREAARWWNMRPTGGIRRGAEPHP